MPMHTRGLQRADTEAANDEGNDGQEAIDEVQEGQQSRKPRGLTGQELLKKDTLDAIRGMKALLRLNVHRKLFFDLTCYRM